MQKLKGILKRKRGSALVFTLMVLSTALIAVIAVSLVSVMERRAAMTTNKSLGSFQVADSGLESVLDTLNHGNLSSSDTISTLAGTLGSTCNSGSIKINSGSVALSFVKADEVTVLTCGDTIADIAKIKSVGTASGTTRAVETAWAATGCGSGAVTYTVLSNSSYGFSGANLLSLKGYLNNGGAIASVSCTDAGGDITELSGNAIRVNSGSAGSISVVYRDTNINNFTQFLCSVAAAPGNCSLNGGYCQGGWKIKGFCE
jgi:Tfp pilus assembly protein PilX